MALNFAMAEKLEEEASVLSTKGLEYSTLETTKNTQTWSTLPSS
jgi:hypothetical protein